MEKGKLRTNRIKRKRNSVIAFNAEGINKTESIYLNNFSSRHLNIKMAKGNSTDPIGMYNELIKYCKEEDIKKEYGDKIYLFLDTDLRDDKIKIIKKLIEKNNDEIELIISVPTFEVWYLNHFRFSSREFSNSKSVLDDLEKYINSYSKSENYYDILKDKTSNAIDNSISLEEYHKNNNSKKELYECNPYTNMYKVINEIIELYKNNENE